MQRAGYVPPAKLTGLPPVDSCRRPAERQERVCRLALRDDMDEERKRGEAVGEAREVLPAVRTLVDAAGDRGDEDVRDLDLKTGIEVCLRAHGEADAVPAQYLVERGRFAEPDAGAVVLHPPGNETLRARVRPGLGSASDGIDEMRDQAFVAGAREGDVARRHGERVVGDEDSAVGSGIEGSVGADGKRVDVGVHVGPVDLVVLRIVRQPVGEHGPLASGVHRADHRQLATREYRIRIRGIDDQGLIVPGLNGEHVERGLIRIGIFRTTGAVDPQRLEAQSGVVASEQIELRKSVGRRRQQEDAAGGGFA